MTPICGLPTLTLITDSALVFLDKCFGFGWANIRPERGQAEGLDKFNLNCRLLSGRWLELESFSSSGTVSVRSLNFLRKLSEMSS
jgi:hypothetical protein